ncbi:MAG: hypothetical protein JJE08_11425 [Proteiniphilum sp.]|nr:hypothetical protein [Proteiniphilum sp.]
MKITILNNKSNIYAVTVALFFGLHNVNAQQGDPKLTEVWEPVPAIVTPAEKGEAPSDAIVLFDGKNLDEWVNTKGEKAGWIVEKGAMTVAGGTGSIKTRISGNRCYSRITEIRYHSEISGYGI